MVVPREVDKRCYAVYAYIYAVCCVAAVYVVGVECVGARVLNGDVNSGVACIP